MKTRLQFIKLALLGGLFATPASAAGTGNGCCAAGGGCCAGKKQPATECCATHDACKGKACCTTTRQYYSWPGDKGGIRWRTVRDCTKDCPLPRDEKRTVCGKGKPV